MPYKRRYKRRRASNRRKRRTSGMFKRRRTFKAKYDGMIKIKHTVRANILYNQA